MLDPSRVSARAGKIPSTGICAGSIHTSVGALSPSGILISLLPLVDI